MTDSDLQHLQKKSGVAPWRIALAAWVESPGVQHTIIVLILINAAVLGMEATPLVHGPYAPWLVVVDHLCLGVFVIELLLKAVVYRWAMLRSGWNLFDILVVGIALVPASGPASVLRGLRVLRVLRLLTAVPSMRRVVTAFLHAIPGLGSVMALMAVFFYVAGVMATGFFGGTHPEWFGHLGRSLYTLFQIMTLESWSMGIARPVMEVHPWSWAFFVPFIVMATFTILNLFIGIIVSTMQELSTAGDGGTSPLPSVAAADLITRLERDLTELRQVLAQQRKAG
jgi:voltage-gated sodium channel